MTAEKPTKYEIIKDEDYFSKMKDITNKLLQIRVCGYFDSFDDAKMYYEFFKVKNPKANIVIIHGYTEFTKKYYEMTWYFHSMGYNVFLYDIRCHGYSQRYSDDLEMTHIDTYETYVKDLDIYINKIVVPNSDGAPVYMYAHSMGGAIAQLYLSKGKTKIKNAVLSAPMIYPCPPPLPRFVLKTLLKFAAKKVGWETRFKYSNEFNPEATLYGSHDSSYNRFRYNLEMRIADKMYRNSYGSNRWTYEAISVVEKVLNKKATNNVKSNLLIVIAGKDTAVCSKHQKKLAKMLNCKYKFFENSKHSIYSADDKTLKEYVDIIMNFLDN